MSQGWHILGAGSMGLLWAASLKQAGHEVSIISQHAPPYPPDITLTDLAKNTHNIAIKIEHNQSLKALNNVLICTKAWQTPSALQAIAPAIHTTTRLVLMQNGMANLDYLRQQFPANALYAASTTEAAQRLRPYAVCHKGAGLTKIGSLNQKPAISALLHCALNLQDSDDIERDLWQKLVINCAINPLSAIHDCLNGELASPAHWPQVCAIIEECLAVAKACGHRFTAQAMQQAVLSVIHHTAQNSSSMREDCLARRRTEIHAINGYIVEQAAKHSIAVPINQSLVQHITGQTYANH